jgi:hypothetical protein
MTQPGSMPPNRSALSYIDEDRGRVHDGCASGSQKRGVVACLVIEIVQATIELHKRKVLVDVRELEGRLGVFDSYFLVTKDFQRLRGRGF